MLQSRISRGQLQSISARLFPRGIDVPIGAYRRSFSTTLLRRDEAAPKTELSELQKTPLYAFHIEHGAKMVPFGGFSMPLQYREAITESHRFTREHATLFDVSHMVKHSFAGQDAAAFLERITPSSVRNMEIGSSKLSALLWPETGGIVDDTVIVKTGDYTWQLITNATTREKVSQYLVGEMRGAVRWTQVWGDGLLALQGPASAEILQGFMEEGEDLKELRFGQVIVKNLVIDSSRVPVMISRGGYTGEDGFEIGPRMTKATWAVADALLKAAGPERLQLAGLGARDTLRIEAGMCLYGHDLDDSTTPVEAGLSWIISPERRETGGFHGAGRILEQLVPKNKGGKGVERRRVGFIVEGAPAREGAEIRNKEGEKIGNITSGCPSPTLGKNIAMGYVKDGYHKAGTEVDVMVRNKARSATAHKMPFVPAKYYK